MTEDRTMLSYLHGQRRFNYRVAGIAVRQNHVLVCREDDDDYVMLPGGRAEMGEASTIVLHREIQEELLCVGEVGQLLFTCENFFSRAGEAFHEIGMYYQISLPDAFPFETGKSCFSNFDEGHELTFDWIPIDSQALTSVNLFPEWIRPRLADLPGTSEHVIAHE